MFNVYHIHLNDKKINQILNYVKMAEETLQELLTRVQNLEQSGVQTQQSLTNIAADITRIKDGLPTEGGLTAAEVGTLRTQLEVTETAINTAKNQAASLDAENEETT